MKLFIIKYIVVMSESEMRPLHLAPSRDLATWENGTRTIDLQEQFRQQNKGLLAQHETGHFNYQPETVYKAARYHAAHEGREAHGYPATAYLQLGLLYACGLYTAKEQGLVRKGVLLSRFWKFHYFDFISFMRRGVIYAWAGGLVAGTIMFGSPDLSLKRAINRYQWFAGGYAVDYDNKEGTLHTR